MKLLLTLLFLSLCASYGFSDSKVSVMKLAETQVKIPEIGIFNGREKTSLSAFNGKFILVNFWATWCAPCVREMASLDILAEQLADQNLVVVAISEDKGGFFEVKPFLEKLKLKNIIILYDTKGLAFPAYGLRGLPTTILISPQGIVIARLEGEAVWNKSPLAEQIKTLITAGVIENKTSEDFPSR